jgi:hypothetical protein
MAGVDRVGALGQVGAVGAEVAEKRGRRRVEQMIAALVGAAVRAGRDSSEGRQQEGGPDRASGAWHGFRLA